ncbi:hypothetical protein GOP47_0007589 [Adiantum capillus-veneris]|uniref:Uncharacterized protein n=1 Tax=Adiantum capillus-veneris TaxID=13818 RepID=A0A9D4V1K2_ADICA|nr:hypothetical protein GOP47_0007589 [Adiantum capillus-veneris]
MENIAESAPAQKVEKVQTQKKYEEEVEGKEKFASGKQVDADQKTKKGAKEGAPIRAMASVLTERNAENTTTTTNTNNKMVSPVLLKLRRNQERRVTPANPVDPVQVPPKQFQGFPADRYMSPTDSIMSPISRGLLARNRRSTRLPQAFVPPKVLDNTFQDAELHNATSS